MSDSKPIICVVDDYMSTARNTSLNLAAMLGKGVEVKDFDRMSSAINFVEKNPVAVLITDASFEGEGWAGKLILAAKKHNPKCKVIIMSGFEEPLKKMPPQFSEGWETAGSDRLDPIYSSLGDGDRSDSPQRRFGEEEKNKRGKLSAKFKPRMVDQIVQKLSSYDRLVEIIRDLLAMADEKPRTGARVKSVRQI